LLWLANRSSRGGLLDASKGWCGRRLEHTDDGTFAGVAKVGLMIRESLAAESRHGFSGLSGWQTTVNMRCPFNASKT
jgi:hypothetical protein